MSAAAALELTGVVKRYGAAEALRGVDFAARAGSVHALVGENGAGKTTLMRIAYGLERADAGRVLVKGAALAPGVPAAIRAGLGMVHQHFMLAEALTVVENVVLGSEPGALIDWGGARARVQELARAHQLAIQPDARVGELGVGELQRVEIVKVLYRGADIIILDEPTAVLGPADARALLEVVRGLREAGKTVVLISHKLDEVMAIADDVTVLRRGAVAARLTAKATSAGDIARAMVGREVAQPEASPAQPGQPVLRITGLAAGRLLGVDLEVRAGEIVGVAGVEGNGQRELVEAVVGLTPARGVVRIAAVDVSSAPVAARFAAGLAHVPEDRQRRGLLLDFALEDNLVLGRLHEFQGRFGIDRARVRAHASRLLGEFDVRPPDPAAPARGLSGGNQQKLVLARELTRPGARVLLAAHPTRGVDIAAAAAIHERLLAARARGLGVLVVSADLEELMRLSDRIVVLLRGRIAGELLREAASEEKLGALMTGAA